VEQTRRTQELRRSNAAGLHSSPRRDNLFTGDLDPGQYFDDAVDNSDLDDYSWKEQQRFRKGAFPVYNRSKGESMRTKNAAGFIFVWPSYSDVVEVFHPDANYPGEVLEAVPMGNANRNEATLKQLANSTREYTRL
jgi:hypothetical protein